MDADLAAIARQFEEQEATLAALQERAVAHGDVVLRISSDVDDEFGEVASKLVRAVRPAPLRGIRV
jgi:hypothetical protein